MRRGDGPKFIVIFAEDPRSWADSSADTLRARSVAFVEWMRGLGGRDVNLGGVQLVHGEGRRYGGTGPETALPGVPGALEVTGFIVVRAATYDDVARIARRNPILDRGGQVIVRRLY